jgi:hypothetical protein
VENDILSSLLSLSIYLTDLGETTQNHTARRAVERTPRAVEDVQNGVLGRNVARDARDFYTPSLSVFERHAQRDRTETSY